MSGANDPVQTKNDVRRVAGREDVATIRVLANELDIPQKQARRLAVDAGVYRLLGDYSRDRPGGDEW